MGLPGVRVLGRRGGGEHLRVSAVVLARRLGRSIPRASRSVGAMGIALHGGGCADLERTLRYPAAIHARRRREDYQPLRLCLPRLSVYALQP